jgi:hypothetical protein
VNQLAETPAADTSDILRWNLIQRRAQEWRVTRAFKIFRQSEIEPILIKGWAAGIHYPNEHPRASIDIDLAVSSGEFEKATAIAMASAGEGLAIDVHRELRHLDTVDWDDLFGNSAILNVDGSPIRILRPEDHLRVLCVHWLTDGGINKDRLWDIYYLVDNRPNNFDWDRFLGSVSPNRRRWFVCTLGLASKYLGLDLSTTPVSDDARDLPRWLINTIERNWAANTKHVPVEVALFRPSVLVNQLDRLIRPNPVASTIAMEGSFDASTRLHYRMAGFAKRVWPALKRVGSTVRQKLK